MPAPPRKDLPDAAAPSAVERSLEDFIARANTTLPSPSTQTTETASAVRAIGSRTAARIGQGKKTKAGAPATLVVLGPQAPLAEVTEIVKRLPSPKLDERDDRDEPRRRPFAAWRLGLAFLAGAVAVLVATRLLSGGPTPVKPTAPPAALVVPAPPPIIVVPIPEAAPSPPVVAAPVVEATAAVAEKPATKPARKSAATRASAKPTAPKKPSGLVDPFAN
jgi:hypothetical protein